MKQCSVAIVGVTGLVGAATLALLEERQFPVKRLYLLASDRSAGEFREFRGEAHTVQALTNFDFTQTDICFFCAGSELAEVYVAQAAACGNIVLDKSAFFRYHDDVPLVIPEVNVSALSYYHKKNIIANPNCNTIPIAVALKPIYDAVGISRLNVATYQSVSGSGKEAITELMEQAKQLLEGRSIHPKVYPQQIAFNVLPHIDKFHENGYTWEEMKIVLEMRKIFNDNALAINPTTVRVPVFYGHAAAVHIETDDKITTRAALVLLEQAPGLKLITGQHPYPTPALDAQGNDFVYVGRVREDISHERGLNLWVVADNLRKGAALNAIQVAEELVRSYL
ncbi:MAG: aspartate-semialdehyde dehydrogenase [Gammaproteobacteria bacterium RIFCSPHIGHO2_12_FULL_41_20]|nr:MAG: aspartate-semialdehyde dehydrogenase [Gammaproteobacteria bacterium RIFCSPHIGHO2_12_FULL_41_20]